MIQHYSTTYSYTSYNNLLPYSMTTIKKKLFSNEHEFSGNSFPPTTHGYILVSSFSSLPVPRRPCRRLLLLLLTLSFSLISVVACAVVSVCRVCPLCECPTLPDLFRNNEIMSPPLHHPTPRPPPPTTHLTTTARYTTMTHGRARTALLHSASCLPLANM